MSILKSFAGSIRLELTSADIAGMLQAINNARIPIENLCATSDITVQFTVMRRNIKKIEIIAQRKGARVVIISYEGTFWVFRNFNQRPFLLVGISILCICAMYLPGRILFVTVEGNSQLPDNIILETANDVGIGFGTSRREVRSEQMKNRLLGALPQLQWAGINTYGCTAVISVRERTLEIENLPDHAVSHVVAACDGVITSCTVTAGSGVCSEGQAVQKGQILISGYTDCGGVITAGRAEGEIFAQTRHEITTVIPDITFIRNRIQLKQTLYSLCLGKKRINFYKGSGISDGSCVKMITQYQLTLPGGYILPVTLVKVQVFSFQSDTRQLDETQLANSLSDFSKRYVQASGIVRKIVHTEQRIVKERGLIVLNGGYDCVEMIGREKGVQIGDFHGKTD